MKVLRRRKIKSRVEHWEITIMNDFIELKEQAARLTRQIGLIRTGLGIDEINKKAEAIGAKSGN